MRDSSPASGTSEDRVAFYVTSSGKPRLQQRSWLGWKKRAWSQRLFGAATSKTSIIRSWLDASTASRPGFLASPGVPPEGEPEKRTSVGSGPQSLTLFQKRNRHFSSARTLGDLFLAEASSSSLLTLPASGSMLNGVLSPQPPLALPTSATESSSWPTATAQDGDSSGGSEPRNRTLNDATQVWRSPCATEAERGVKQRPTLKDGEHSLVTQIENWPSPNVPNGGRTTNTSNYREDGSKQQAELSAVAALWPTPDASLMNDGQTEEARAKRKARELEKKYNGNGGGEPLAYVVRMWPTPMTADDGDKVTLASHQGGLTIAARQWPTIASRDYRTPNAKPFSERGGGVKGEQLPNFVASHFSPQVLGMNSGETSSLPAPALRRRLNPAFVCWLMAWPWFWTRAEPTSFGALETAVYRLRLQRHLSYLLRGL